MSLSPFERAATRPKLGAMRYRYGVGQHWVRIAPLEHDDLLLHRIAQLRKLKGFNDPNNIFARKTCTFSNLPPELQGSARYRLAVSSIYPTLQSRCLRGGCGRSLIVCFAVEIVRRQGLVATIWSVQKECLGV